MQKIKVKTPAKINLTLEILGKRPDGFHEIQSIMQAVSLYDYLTISVEDLNPDIEISGNSDRIPYDKSNLVYKAAKIFLEKTGIFSKKIKIHIEKNIPVAAGLAGGSSNAAGTLFGLNRIFGDVLSNGQIHELAKKLGSDVNFCLEGGACIATSRGETLKKISSAKLDLVIIKPKNLFISAGEAYTKYAALPQKPEVKGLEEMVSAISNNEALKISSLLNNHLEYSIIPDYSEIQKIKDYLIKKGCLGAIMSGSGPSVFGILPDRDAKEYVFFASSQALSDVEFFIANTIESGVSVQITETPSR